MYLNQMSSIQPSNFVQNRVFTCKNNRKTRMCNNILKSGSCPFGEKCSFAHDPSEIRKAPCAFQKNCKNTRCPYSHDDENELVKVVTEVENRMRQLAIQKEDEKNLVIKLDDDEDTSIDIIQSTEKKIQEEISYQEKYYEGVKLRIGQDETEALKYMEEYDKQSKNFNKYSIDINMSEYDFKKLEFYLQSIGCDYKVKQNS